MLTIIIPTSELYDEVKNEFIYYPSVTLRLSHSLSSISKWESKWHKPFFSNDDKTNEQVLDYIQCMSLDGDINEEIYGRLTPENYNDISNYINDSMTATSFLDDNSSKTQTIITSEIIYYWLIAYNIPFECQYWHINRLLTLVKVCKIKNDPPKKMSRAEVLSRNKELNKQRKQKLNTKG